MASKYTFCKGCNRRLRPASIKLKDAPNTVVYGGKGYCATCRRGVSLDVVTIHYEARDLTADEVLVRQMVDNRCGADAAVVKDMLGISA